MNVSEIKLEHLLLSRKDLVMSNNPFVHITVKDFFPEQLYQILDGQFPGETVFEKTYFEGKKFLKKPDLLAMKSEFPAWSRVFELVESGDFIGDCYRVLRKHVSKSRPLLANLPWTLFHEREVIGSLPVSVSLELSVLPTGACLTPHTDKLQKLASMIFYFPPSDWKPEYGDGTVIFSPKNHRQARNWMNRHLEFCAVNREHTSHYASNTMFAFLKAANSYHGVEPIKAPPGVLRRAFIINISIAPSKLWSRILRVHGAFLRRLEGRAFRNEPDLKFLQGKVSVGEYVHLRGTGKTQNEAREIMKLSKELSSRMELSMQRQQKHIR